MSEVAQHILTLERRREYLQGQIRERGERPGFDFRKAEEAALTWALSIVRPVVPATWDVGEDKRK